MQHDKQLIQRFLESPDSIRNLVITNNQVAIVKHVRDCGLPNICARELAELKNISVQNASIQLSKLWLRGWLTRHQLTDETGGIYYRYSAAI